VFEDTHDQIIVPMAIDPGRFAFDSFLHKATGSVCRNCALIDRQNPQINPM
jgi:hypothetical protein